MDTLHFISGLPRSGSTLLAALLRQNPAVHAGMTSPVGGMVAALMREMSQRNETAVFVNDSQRAALLRGLFSAYYTEQAGRLVFDTNRGWCARLPTLAALFPQARVVCCVRHMPWVLDSLERLIRANPLEFSSIFNFDTGGTVYSRIEGLAGGNGLVGFAFNALREAAWGDQADRLLLVSYESLTARPQAVLDAVYDFIGLPRFAHDPANVRFDEAAEFDRRLGTPGLHRVAPIVQATPRRSVLPPELFARFERDSFWQSPGACPPGLRVV